MAYDFLLSIHCTAGFIFMLECFQVEFMRECAFYGALWFYFVNVLIAIALFYARMSPVDECVPTADYTWCKMYRHAIKRVD